MSKIYKAYRLNEGEIQIVEEGSDSEKDLLGSGMNSIAIPGMDHINAGRKEIINNIINSGINNPHIDNLDMASIFKEISGEVLVFERTGIDLISNSLQDMVNSDSHLKQALIKEVEPGSGITVINAIIGAIQNA